MKVRELKAQIDSKLFNGYVMDPIPMVFFPAIVFILILILAIIFTVGYCSFLSSTPEIVMQEAVFVEYEWSRGSPVYRLQGTDGTIYNLRTTAIEGVPLLDEMLSQQEKVIIECEPAPSNGEALYYDIWRMENSRGITVVSPEDVYEDIIKYYIKSLFIFWGLLFLYALYLGGMYYILSNAPKYPRLAKLCVRSTHRQW